MGYDIFDGTMVDMTWPEIEKAIKQEAIVLLPLGVIEEHGPHMGLAVDIYVSYTVAKLAKPQLESRGIQTLIAPPYYWGINNLTGCFPGSFNVRPETMKAVIYDTLSSLKSWGVNYVFTVNWHAEYGHSMAVLEAVKEARTATGIKAYCILIDYEARNCRQTGKEDYIVIEKTTPLPGPPPKYLDLHAGSLETGIMLYYFPEQVKAGLVKSLEPTRITFADLKTVRQGGNEVRKLIPAGYFGNPAGFNLETGKRYVEGMARDYANLIESVIKGSYQPPELGR